MNPEEYRKKKLKEQEEYWHDHYHMWLYENNLLMGHNAAMGLVAPGGGVLQQSTSPVFDLGYAIRAMESNGEYLSSPALITDPNIVPDQYFEISFTAASGKVLELTSLEFEVSNYYNLSNRKVTYLGIQYSLNSDFSSPVTLYSGTDLDISSYIYNINELAFSHTFLIPIEVTDSIYFRFYPYYTDVSSIMGISYNTFFINGTIQGETVIPSQLLGWGLDGSSSGSPQDSYDYFTLDSSVSSADYNLAGIIDDFTTPVSYGGRWRYAPLRYYSYFNNIQGSAIGLNTEIEYSDLVKLVISQGSSAFNLQIEIIPTSVSITKTSSSTPVTNVYTSEIPLNGIIKIQYNSPNWDVYVDDVLIGQSTFASSSLAYVYEYPLYFNADYLGNPLGDCVYKRIKLNDYEWIFPEGTGSTTVNSKGVVTTLHETPIVTGINIDITKNEFVSSSPGNYFGDTIDGLYFKYIIQPPLSGDNLISQIDGTFQNGIIVIPGNTDLQFSVATSGITEDGYWLFPTATEGDIIELTGAGIVLECYVNGVLQTDLGSGFTSGGLTGGQGELLYFNGVDGASTSNGRYSYLKINNHEWLPENWSSPTTTNSQGIISTLNSNGDTNDMIISSEDPEQMWVI